MKRSIRGGIYLIIDPSVNRDILLSRLKEVVQEPVAAVQVWDNFNADGNWMQLIEEILQLCHARNIPVLINNRWEVLKQLQLDGIHFDDKPDHLIQLKRELNREIITGITCGNDLSVVKWADDNGLDYISFCSMFPSSTANSCELVTFDTVKKARSITAIPLFLAGGIQPQNMDALSGLDYSGIAAVSGIMNSDNPRLAIKKYQQKLKQKL